MVRLRLPDQVVDALLFTVYLPNNNCCCCCSHINSHNQVRGHRTDSSHSGAEEYPQGQNTTKPNVVHAYVIPWLNIFIVLRGGSWRRRRRFNRQIAFTVNCTMLPLLSKLLPYTWRDPVLSQSASDDCHVLGVFSVVGCRGCFFPWFFKMLSVSSSLLIERPFLLLAFWSAWFMLWVASRSVIMLSIAFDWCSGVFPSWGSQSVYFIYARS